MIPVLSFAQAIDDYRLKLRFQSGHEKIFDMKPYLEKGIFKALKDEELFKQVGTRFGTVCWPNGVDFDPEALFELSEEA